MEGFSILLVEDDTDAALWIREFFDAGAFDFCLEDTVTKAIDELKGRRYDLVLLDLSLPDYSGYEMLRFCAANYPNVPVIILSAHSDKNSLLQAFKLGAKDYMKKPIDLEELEARIWVQLKTSSYFFASESFDEKNKSGFTLQNGTICYQDRTLQLTQTEKALLEQLIKHAKQAISRDQLCKQLSGTSSHRTLDYHIQNLRKKLQIQTGKHDLIKTEYGFGYSFVS